MRFFFTTILEDVASAASHDIGASNAIESFEQSLDMLRVPLVAILARDLRLKVFYQTLGDVSRGARHDIGAKFAFEKVVNNPGRCSEGR